MRNVRVLAPLFAAACLAQNPVVVENAWVRVVSAQNKPGQLSRPHVHKMNRIMIHLDPGTLRLDNKETGTARDVPFRAGQVRWDPRVGLHTSENVSGSPIHIIEIELNDAPPRPAAAVKLTPPPKAFHQELDNAQVRILRTTLAAHAKIPASLQQTPLVAVRLTDGQTLFRPAAGEPIENDAGASAEWIVVQLK